MSSWFIFGIIIFLVFDLAIVVFVLIKRFSRPKLGSKDLQYIQSHWIRIIDSFHKNPAQAVIDADKLLDYTLARCGFEKGTLGEKLKLSGKCFKDLNGVWSAHKLRNKAAHELGGIDVNEAREALKQFKKALNDLGNKL
jgi:hypothetical protein